MSVAGETIAEARTTSVIGSNDWQKITLRATPPLGAEILLVKLISRNNEGKVWFDDVLLKSGSEVIDLPAPLVSNSSFENDHFGFNWSTKGSGVEVVEGVAHTGKRSIMFSKTRLAYAQSSPIAVKNREYFLSAWVKAENATGDNYLAISWHRRKVIAKLNKATLEARLQYAINFKNSRKVPIYVGEFIYQKPRLNPALSITFGTSSRFFKSTDSIGATGPITPIYQE